MLHLNRKKFSQATIGTARRETITDLPFAAYPLAKEGIKFTADVSTANVSGSNGLNGNNFVAFDFGEGLNATVANPNVGTFGKFAIASNASGDFYLRTPTNINGPVTASGGTIQATIFLNKTGRQIVVAAPDGSPLTLFHSMPTPRTAPASCLGCTTTAPETRLTLSRTKLRMDPGSGQG